MSFIADKQTLDDLNLLGKYRNNSIYSFFNSVRTEGGARQLDQMFRAPLTNADAINRRSGIFSYFQQAGYCFPLSEEQYTVMENYLTTGSGGNIMTSAVRVFRLKSLKIIGLDQEFNSMRKGLRITIEALNLLYDFFFQLHQQNDGSLYGEDVKSVIAIFQDKRFSWLRQARKTQQLSFLHLVQYDYQLRTALAEEMKTLLHAIHLLDVYISVAELAKANMFSYARAYPSTANFIRIRDCKHPVLEKAVGNPVSLSSDKNLIFLTGANMAGKSTFMKSAGINVYLAHMGFPVAAVEMEFSVMDGIYSSINVPDDLNRGFSHFYAEVLRVKKVANEVSSGKRLLVIFDELFKGTNVKDAYDATLACTEAFAEYRNCFYIISTHIIEVGEKLQNTCKNVQFNYMPTIMEGAIPRYPYRITEGISEDRHGMMILENEGILNMLVAFSGIHQ